MYFADLKTAMMNCSGLCFPGRQMNRIAARLAQRTFDKLGQPFVERGSPNRLSGCRAK